MAFPTIPIIAYVEGTVSSSSKTDATFINHKNSILLANQIGKIGELSCRKYDYF